jgi:hypothetical protein
MKLTLLALACGLCLHAQNRTSNFDDFPITTNTEVANPFRDNVGLSFNYVYGSSAPDGGMIIVGQPAGQPFSDAGVTAVSNGTPYMGVFNGSGETLVMTYPGGTFALVSINFDKLVTSDAIVDSTGFPNANTINVLGTLADGGTVVTTVRLNGGTAFETFTFPSEWQNLVSVTFTSNGDGTSGPNATVKGLFAMDKIVFTPVCHYAPQLNGLPYGGRTFGAGGGSGFFNVFAPDGCTWSVSGMPAWITVTTTKFNVSYQVQPNTGPERSGTITIGGDKSHTVEQASGLATGLGNKARFAHVTSGGGWRFTVIEVNLGSSAALGRLNLSNETGGSLQLPWTFPQLPAAPAGPLFASTLDRTLNPNAHIVIESKGPDNAATLVGSGLVNAASTDNIAAFGIFSYPALHWDAVVPPETRSAPNYTLAFDNTGALATGVALSVTFQQAQDVGVVIRDATGAQIGTDTITLPASGHTSFMLFQKYPVTIGIRGTIQFTRGAAGQITVLGLRANGAALTTLPVLGNVGTSGGSISHVTYNGGFTSSIFVVNTGTSSAPFTLSFFGENGSPLSVPLLLPESGTSETTAALTNTLAPGAMLLIETQAQDAMTGVSGSAQLTTTGNISAFEIFRWTTFGQEASVPLETRTPASYVLVFDNTGGLTTGVALANGSTAAAAVTVNIYDDLGTLLQTGTINLSGHAHTSFLLPDAARFPISANQRGLVEFVVPQGAQISAIGLRATGNGTLTTIPVLTR